MFGFLPAPCSTCHGADQSTYRQYFCGLSSALARDYGPAARMFTNRDGTFFSILAAAQQEHPAATSCVTCCNPFGKKRDLCDRDLHASWAAAVSVCGVSTKLRDDASDESGPRRYLSAAAAGLISRNVAKATSILHNTGFPVEKVRTQLNTQPDLEKHSAGNWQLAAAPSATAFGTIFENSGALETTKRHEDHNDNLAAAGQALGRIIYLTDACEDLEEDRKKQRFNPFFQTSSQQMIHWFEQEYEKLTSHFGKLEMNHHSGLLNSILIDGLYHKSARILGMGIAGAPRKEKRKKEKRSKGADEPSCCWRCCDSCTPCDCDCCCPCDT